MKIIPGLNGIRAIAVLLVIISHRFPVDHVVHTFPIGAFGVDIFFVLSGFLISRILFQKLKSIEEGEDRPFQVIKNFFVRRALRIFPIYYLTLFFLYITDGVIGNNFKENVGWYALYVANYLNYFQNKWYGSLAHLWSLSVEEQFYLVWPFFLLFVIRKRIFWSLVMIIILGSIYPLFFTGIVKVLTLACINSFGIGALLAYFEILNPKYEKKVCKWINNLFFPTIVLIVLNYTYLKLHYFPSRLVISLFTLSVIANCRYNSDNVWVRKVLSNRPLNFIGMISYGVYLYHNLIPKYWKYGVTFFDLNLPVEFSYWTFILQTLLIIIFSYISYAVIEKPILKLKVYFT